MGTSEGNTTGQVRHSWTIVGLGGFSPNRAYFDGYSLLSVTKLRLYKFVCIVAG